MNKHLQEFDVIRATATLAVIAIHITASYMDFTLAYIWNHAMRFAVPLFIIISGFLLYYAEISDAALPARTFYRKRLDRILWPYLVWTLIYCLLNAYLSGSNHLIPFINTLGKSMLWGTGYYHLWFLPIILQLYLLYPLLRSWMKKSPGFLMLGSMVISLASQTLVYLHTIQTFSLPAYGLLYVRAFPVWLFYFVFGMYMVKVGVPREPSPWHTPLFLVIWFVSLGLMLLDSILTSYMSIVRPSVMLFAVSSFLFLYTLCLSLGKEKARPLLTWLSAQSFLIYLMHPLLLTALVYSANKIGHPGLWAGNRGVLGLYFFTVVLTVMGTYMVSTTPLASWLGGVRTKRK